MKCFEFGKHAVVFSFFKKKKAFFSIPTTLVAFFCLWHFMFVSEQVALPWQLDLLFFRFVSASIEDKVARGLHKVELNNILSECRTSQQRSQ